MVRAMKELVQETPPSPQTAIAAATTVTSDVLADGATAAMLSGAVELGQTFVHTVSVSWGIVASRNTCRCQQPCSP